MRIEGVNMKKVMISPSRYVQGAGAIQDLGGYVKGLGAKPLVIGGRHGLGGVRAEIEAGFTAAGLTACFEGFGGECCRSEIDRIGAIVRAKGIDVMVGVGGGKTLATAKTVAYGAKLPVVIVPTIAATDAPCRAVAIIYTPASVFESVLVLPKNPDLVLVDTAIVAKAPVRLLVSGMGDALATWFEADACTRAFAANVPGGAATAASLTLARLCYDTLLEYGSLAKLAVEKGVVTEAGERIVEANTLLSGLGFESAGLAAAHAIHNGFTALPETHQCYHGEKVAFGTLVQLVLENRPRNEMEEVLAFCGEVGLPTTLADIGVVEVTDAKLRQVAEAACATGESIHNEPFPVFQEAVVAAIVAADAIGTAFNAD